MLLGLLLLVALLALLAALGAWNSSRHTKWLLKEEGLCCVDRSCDHGCAPPVQSLPGIDCCDTVFFDSYRNVTGEWLPTRRYPAELPEEFYQTLALRLGRRRTLLTFNDSLTEQGIGQVHCNSTPFRRSVEPGMFGPGSGVLDILKAVITTRGAFRVAPDQTFIAEFTVSGNQSVGRHPFRPFAVPDAEDDPRLAYKGPFIYDPVSGLHSGFVFTNKSVWGLHSRLSLANRSLASWGSGTRLRAYTPPERLCLRLLYDRQQGCISWFLEGEEVKKICDLSDLPPLNQRTLWVNRGGDGSGAVDPNSFMAAYMAGHLLDARLEGATDKGLVMADPAIPYIEPTMWALKNTDQSRLFGQGSILWICRLRAYLCSC